MKKFLLSLQFIFKPNYWVMNREYNESIDIMMNALMDLYEFTNITEYTAYLGSTEIWVTNQPYACMVPRSLLQSGRASRLTIQRGIKKLKATKIKLVLEKIQELKQINNDKKL